MAYRPFCRTRLRFWIFCCSRSTLSLLARGGRRTGTDAALTRSARFLGTAMRNA